MGTSGLQPSQAEVVGDLRLAASDWHLKWGESSLVGLSPKTWELHYLWVDSVGIRLSCRTPSWWQRIAWWQETSLHLVTRVKCGCNVRGEEPYGGNVGAVLLHRAQQWSQRTFLMFSDITQSLMKKALH